MPSSHELAKVVAAADAAISAEDFDAVMDFYAEDATLVIRPGLNATGKEQIRKAFEAIAEYFNHTLKVRQGGMQVIEGGDTALVLARTLLEAGTVPEIERLATYVFKKEDDTWRCTVDNSYGTGLIAPEPATTLHLLCGKIGAGKSTLAAKLATAPKTVLVSEDAWLARLYPDEILCVADYARCSARLRAALADHVCALLGAGTSVVLDVPANTLDTRKWARQLIERAGVAHQLHYLDVPNEICKARLRQRNVAGEHPFAPSDAQFDEITRYFVPPAEDEGFNVIRHQ